MIRDMFEKIIRWVFLLLFATLPLVFITRTSELFEFNKMIIVYIATTIATSAWLLDSIKKKKLVINSTHMTIPIVMLLAGLLLSTFVSIDFRTSLFGYYSRFHGGLTSYISYTLLFFIFTTYINKKTLVLLIKVIIGSTSVAALYASLEHFGASPSCLFVTGNFDVACWVQDVQNRVFGTFGQPNWLAAWLVAINPFVWWMMVTSKLSKNKYTFIYLFINLLFLLALYFTKSRSGFIAYIISFALFWLSTFYLEKKHIKGIVSVFVLSVILIVVTTLTVDTPWKITFIPELHAQEETVVEPNLDFSGTSSGEIRKIVWEGALKLFFKYPLLGTGLDTFAYSYYETRPIAHNYVSEWNFVYNRAHNEYLNFLATTGIVGSSVYVIFLLSIVVLCLKKYNLLNATSLASLSSILVTNFFGFSTVTVGLLLFMLPAFVIAQENTALKNTKDEKQTNNQKALSALILFVTCYALFEIGRMWHADILYASGEKHFKLKDYYNAQQKLESAVSMKPNEPVYYNELSRVYLENGDISKAVVATEKMIRLSPHNVSLLKQAANNYSRLFSVAKEYTQKEVSLLEQLMKLAPTDPSIRYKYASLLAKIGLVDESIKELEATINMKDDYKIANQLLAYIYEDIGEKQKAHDLYVKLLHYYPSDEKIKEDLNNLDL